MLKIWGRKNSINVMKVLWCADELGLAYERVDAGMAFGVVHEEAYGRLNPNRRVPTIEDDGFVLWESNVIVRYLSAKHGTGTLCPADPQARAIADQWMDWQQTGPHADLTYVFWGKVRNDSNRQDPAKTARCERNLIELWGHLDRHLDGRDFVCGDALTMGDIPLGAAAWRWFNMDIDHGRLANVEAWHERLKQRPAFRANIMQPLT